MVTGGVHLFQAPLFVYPGYVWIAALSDSRQRLDSPQSAHLFAAMLIRTHSRGVLLPILLYPVTFPACSSPELVGTVALLQAEPNLDLARFWAAVLHLF